MNPGHVALSLMAWHDDSEVPADEMNESTSKEAVRLRLVGCTRSLPSLHCRIVTRPDRATVTNVIV